MGGSIALFDTASDLIWSDVFKKFPDLKMSLSERGVDWIPHFLERVDHTYRRHGAAIGADFGDRMPSDVFKTNIITCFSDEHSSLVGPDGLNVDMVTWKCDFPYSGWPQAREHLAKHFDSVTDGVIDKIGHQNAMRLYSFEPFKTRPRERCTVGVLRAEVAGHDVSTVSHGPTGYRSEFAETEQVAHCNERHAVAETAR
jgi:hypothetical protein